MAADPFADLEPAEEIAQQEQTPQEEAPETDKTNTAPTKKETSMPVSGSEAKIVTTLKGGAGYDAPWIVIHSDTVEEALGTLNDSSLRDLVEQTQKVGQFFASKGKSSKPAGSGKPAGANQAPANAPTPPEGYVYKTGMGKNGRPWYAFMGANRADKLDPIWLNADGTRR